ncbi:MAG TPA: caspase family protein [Fimbriimonadaceae bacterium]|nr:caspase family protein [Fimbriimonadaceae bacterium]
MNFNRFSLVLLMALAASLATAQAWRTSYEQGLAAARAERWGEARTHFQRAAAYRPEDQSAATPLPGPVSERREWRGGAPYSPNFLAAYSAYREALRAKSEDAEPLLQAAAAELETLLAKEQHSPETYYVLARVYERQRATEKRTALESRVSANANRLTWKVDGEAILPEERALIAPSQGDARRATPDSQQTITVKAGDPIISPPAGGARPVPDLPGVTRVPPVPTKFALVIGNAASRLPEGALPFAGDDAQRIREALVLSAGYPEENVDLVLNASAAQIMASARALAERVGEDNTVFIYFAGAGANIDGKDYLAGIDTELPTDSSTMIAKNELYRLFMAKGARIFSFFQASRPIVSGRYFGMEVPLFGSIAQSQATLPGEVVHSVVRNGKQVGIYTDALASVLEEFRSNRIPILEFGWQVFYKIRRGDTGTTGGGSRQTPTLPVLSNMASDAPF